MEEFEPDNILVEHGGARYKVVAEGDHFTVYTADGRKVAVLQFWENWRAVEGELNDEQLQSFGDAIDSFYE